ncbi:uncharacterized protein LOC128734514 [Sabethes cyaneus]|uniref:uncharacterized protein LOC128734514 n=1 Tax=Sabethes cyaneus TaxID=53552 RepID=UPI00237DE6C7|nr:uncharacterized protein LOC128734514 [Sabethes cyaneus]XP_053684731.1 uncharacterized protein LOC128734514 [Sabethes cyaneus]XP_053684732.1 uncharacterized protein LOC128734514 [Sabethes cyaneus]
MEIRWNWIAPTLLIVICHMAVTHDMVDSRDSVDLNVVPLSTIRSKGSQSSTQPALEESIVLKGDSGRQALNHGDSTETLGNVNSELESTHGSTTKKVKKYAAKENKKYRKKYISNGDYRETTSQPSGEPLIREHRTAGDSEDEQTEKTSKKFSDESNKPHSRKKRLIWVTDDGRLALPPGTTLTIAPTIALPFVRYPPTGFLSNISVSLPITIDFDKLGLTDNQNPLGVLPPLFARSMGRAAGSFLADYVSDYMRNRRRKRSVPSFGGSDKFKITANVIDEDGDDNDGERLPPELPEEHKHAFHGGERALLYTVVEDFIANFGLDGKACMLRAICEVHSKPVENFGLVGEFLKLFFTASLSPYSEHLSEYVSAENIGKGKTGPGECFPYYKDCPRSLFRTPSEFQKRYSATGETGESSNGQDGLYEDSIDDFEREIRSSGKPESTVESKDEAMIQLDSILSEIAM